jgi:predicted transcriptional regulator
LTEVIRIGRIRAQDPGVVVALTTVREIMSTELVTVDPTAHLTETARIMFAGRAGSVLVLEGGSLVGIFTERDILRALGDSSSADLARVSAVSKGCPRTRRRSTPRPRWRRRSVGCCSADSGTCR